MDKVFLQYQAGGDLTEPPDRGVGVDMEGNILDVSHPLLLSQLEPITAQIVLIVLSLVDKERCRVLTL